MIRRLLIAATLALVTCPAAAGAAPYLPPAGHLFAGVTGGHNPSAYERAVRSHPAVFQFFTSWYAPSDGMFAAAERAHARLMLHIGTTTFGREVITPKGIATGTGDAYLLRLNSQMASAAEPVYVRLMAEMDGHWNAYCAYTASGRAKGASWSTAMFRRAWQRTVLILRGGPLTAIDARLRALHVPPVRGARATTLPRPQVAFLWVPQVAGAPDIPGNSPRAYWPGAGYVDWVGTDFYSKFPNFSGLERFYGAFGGKPFAFGEWALWGRDDPGFVARLFGWVRSHPRVRMLMYNQGNRADGPFALKHYPHAASAIAHVLAAPRFSQFAPEFRGAG